MVVNLFDFYHRLLKDAILQLCIKTVFSYFWIFLKIYVLNPTKILIFSVNALYTNTYDL